MQKESLRCDLVFIANFANFVQAFTFLEKRSETLVDRLQVFDKVIDNIHKIPGIVGEDIKKVLKGKSNAQLIGMNTESAVCFKYAPVTSAEKLKEFWVVFPYSFDHAALSTCKELLNGDTTETAYDRLAHRWHWDFGIPPIAHASHTSFAYQRMNQLHEHRQFKGDSSLMDTQPYV
ncbi:hypothetical protein T06_16504 [Trichinella sp. T6]|nr:hypothetical protein T06_16504 [Trichinella sp. T6]